MAGGDTMRLLICGGRTFSDITMLHMGILQVCEMMGQRLTLVIHGDAPGADSLAQGWCEFNGVPTLRFPAAWSDLNVTGVRLRFGRHGAYNAAAGSQRNQRMLDEGRPDAWLALPGGSGTADMTARCKRAGLPGLLRRLKVSELKADWFRSQCTSANALFDSRKCERTR